MNETRFAYSNLFRSTPLYHSMRKTSLSPGASAGELVRDVHDKAALFADPEARTRARELGAIRSETNPDKAGLTNTAVTEFLDNLVASAVRLDPDGITARAAVEAIRDWDTDSAIDRAASFNEIEAAATSELKQRQESLRHALQDYVFGSNLDDEKQFPMQSIAEGKTKDIDLDQVKTKIADMDAIDSDLATDELMYLLTLSVYHMACFTSPLKTEYTRDDYFAPFFNNRNREVKLQQHKIVDIDPDSQVFTNLNSARERILEIADILDERGLFDYQKQAITQKLESDEGSAFAYNSSLGLGGGDLTSQRAYYAIKNVFTLVEAIAKRLGLDLKEGTMPRKIVSATVEELMPLLSKDEYELRKEYGLNEYHTIPAIPELADLVEFKS